MYLTAREIKELAKRLCRENGLTQNAISERLGVSRPAVSFALNTTAGRPENDMINLTVAILRIFEVETEGPLWKAVLKEGEDNNHEDPS